MPCFVATSAGISTHASHATCVIVSGTSCSHALLAPRPSKKRNDGYASSVEPAGIAFELRRARRDGADLRRHAGRRGDAPDAALLERGGPLPLHDRLPRRLHERLEARPRQRALALFGDPERRAADREHHVAERPRVADRHHRGLHEPDDALARRRSRPTTRASACRAGRDARAPWSRRARLAKLTTRPTFFTASANLRPPGSVNAGLIPAPRNSTSISPFAIACTSAVTSAYGVTRP